MIIFWDTSLLINHGLIHQEYHEGAPVIVLDVIQVEGLEQQKEIEDLQVRRNMGSTKATLHIGEKM